MNKRLLILTLALISCGIVAQAQNSFAILVDSETYRHCKDEIEDYRESVANGGLDAFIIEKKWECPEEIKDTLIHFYNTRSLEGTVFVGDIPIPMIRQGQHFTSAFKMDEDSKYHAMRDTSVPSDRFYDDFNLKFQFVGRDSVETHFYYYNLAADSPQRIECDIYSGRIKPSSDRGDKYEELSRYLKKVVRLKKETNYLDKVTSYTGDGSFSNSLVAWKEETITLKEQMPQIYETGDGAKFMIFAMYPYMKEHIVAEIQRDDLDYIMFHEHGVPERQYITGIPLADDMNSFYEIGKLHARNQYRRLLRRGRTREEAIASMQKSYSVDTTWYVNAMEPEVLKADSLQDVRMGIVLDDIHRIKPNVRIALFDACYNGDFRESDCIANRYIMSGGNSVVSLGNSVNVLQDKSSADLMGMLSLGYNVGQWQQQINILESHVIGDPTFAFAPSYKMERPDLKNTSIKYWKKYLDKRYPCDVQALALSKLFNLQYNDMSDLLLETYRQSDYYMLRLMCMNLSAHYYDENYIHLLKESLDDPYEYIRRKGVYYASKVGREDLIQCIVDMYFREYNSKRVAFNMNYAASHFPGHSFVEAFDKTLAEIDYIFNKEDFKKTADKVFQSAISIRDMTQEDLKDKSKSPERRGAYVGGMRNMPYAHMAEDLLNIVTDNNEDEKLRTKCAEVLGWYVRAHNRGMIVEKLQGFLESSQKAPEKVENEIVKTINRLKAYMR